MTDIEIKSGITVTIFYNITPDEFVTNRVIMKHTKIGIFTRDKNENKFFTPWAAIHELKMTE